MWAACLACAILLAHATASVGDDVMAEVGRLYAAGAPPAAVLEVLDRSLRVSPHLARAHTMRGVLLDMTGGDAREVLASYDHSLAIAPQYAATVQPSYTRAAVALASRLRESCEWDALEALWPRVLRFTLAELAAGEKPHLEALVALRFEMPAATRHRIAEAHASAAAEDAQKALRSRPSAAAQWAAARGGAVGGTGGARPASEALRQGRRIRVGYVSADFGVHAMMNW